MSHIAFSRTVCRNLLGAATIFAALSSGAPLPGAENRITVTGTGTLEVAADEIQIAGVIAGNAELASEAFKKFQQNQRRAEEAIKGLKIEGLSFHVDGVVALMPNSAERVQALVYAVDNGNGQQQNVVFYQNFHLKLAAINKLSPEKLDETLIGIIDKCKDASVTLGASADDATGTVANFQYGKLDESEQKALELAAADARTKAERLAKLLGVKLGPVVSASEISDVQQQNQYYQYPMYGSMRGRRRATPPAAQRQTIEVTAQLRVEFAIEK